MGANLITWSGQAVTPQNDAILYDSLQISGIFAGCDITYTGSNQIHIDSGFGIIRGRLFSIDDTTVTVSLPNSGTQSGRVYLHLDLSATDEPLSILSVTSETLPDLEHDASINTTNGQEDMELCTYVAGTSTLSDVTTTYKTAYNIITQVVMQQMGLTNCHTEFASDGQSVTQTFADGSTAVIEFGTSTIEMTYTDRLGTVHTGAVTFNSDGSIDQTVN